MSNLHPNLSDDQLHVAKGFASAFSGQRLWRNEKGNQTFDNSVIFPQALSIANSYSAPPTENYNDIYILNGTSNHANWDGVSVDNWVRYDGTTWYGITPNEGDRCYVNDVHEEYMYDGTTWNPSLLDSNNVYEYEYSGTATGANTDLTLLDSITLPANTLVDNGDCLIIRANFVMAANANSKLCRIRFNNEIAADLTTTTSSDRVMLEARLNKSSGFAIGFGKGEGISSTNISEFSILTTWSSTILVEFLAKNNVASASDITLFDHSIDILRKRS